LRTALSAVSNSGLTWLTTTVGSCVPFARQEMGTLLDCERRPRHSDVRRRCSCDQPMQVNRLQQDSGPSRLRGHSSSV
jgi:hypothetical protein